MTDLATQNKTGWVKVAFGDVVKLVRERANNPAIDGFNRVVGLEHLDPGELKISRWADISDGTTFTNVFRPGQVLFGKRRAYQRKVALADFEGVCSGDIYVLESSSPQLMPELLPYICQSDAFFDHAVGTSAGSLSPRTNWTSLVDFEFMLPPLQEQARLVGAMQNASSMTNMFRLLQLKSSKLMQAKLKFLFGELVKDQLVPKIKLFDLLKAPLKNGVFVNSDRFGSGTKLINVSDCYDGFEVKPEKLDRVPITTNEAVSFSAEKDDIIFTRSSLVRNGIGRSILVPETDEPLVFECHLIRARPDNKTILSRYLAHFFNSCYSRQHILSYAQTTTQTTIDQGALELLTVPKPALEIQLELLEKLDNQLHSEIMIGDRLHQANVLSKKLVQYVMRNF